MKARLTKQLTSMACSLSLCLAASLLGAAIAQGATAIKAGKLIDTKSGTVLPNQIILIEGDRIKQVGANLKIPSDAQVIDLSQETVLPGLIDCHAHITDAVQIDPIVELQKSAAMKAL